MEYQRVMKSAQKDQSKTSSFSPHQTALNRVKTHPLLDLQRTIGNQAVQALLHSGNVQINPTTQVVMEPRFGHDFSQISVHSTQPAALQTKLMVNQPGDSYEQEADQVAERVMCMKQPNQSNQQDAVSYNTETVLDSVHNNSSGGNALAPETRQFFEPRFGHSFVNVRVHTDHSANESARSLGARAYTIGEHITFASGEYQPSAREGRQLLAHELAHVVQQSHVATRRGPHTLAASLSQAPSHQAQRKLIATGDLSGFKALANSVITVQQEVEVSAAGVVSLRSTNVQGPPTPADQELVSVLNTVISDPKTTTIEFIHGKTSTRPSDIHVIGGNYALARVDLDDIAMAGPSTGRGVSAGAWLAHEIQEQYRRQVHSEGFPVAHAAGLATEARASGATLTPGNLTQINATTIQWTDIYTYPDGTREAVTVTVTNGNITNVSRKTLP